MQEIPKSNSDEYPRLASKKGRPSALLECATRRSALLGASLAVVGVVALGLGIGFCQVFASLCFSVELGAFAVVGPGFRVDPYFSISAADRGGGGRCSFGRFLVRSRCWSFSGRRYRGTRWRACFCRRCGGLGKTRGSTEQANRNCQNTELRFHGDSFMSCFAKFNQINRSP